MVEFFLKISNEVTVASKLKYEQNYNVILKILFFYLKQDVKIINSLRNFVFFWDIDKLLQNCIWALACSCKANELW